MYVVKVHPHRALLENDYFIKAIEHCESERDKEMHRYETGVEEPDITVELASACSRRTEAGTEWERMQRLPDADYLQRTVLPVLFQGMRVIDVERPAAPLEYLAVYLLNHQD